MKKTLGLLLVVLFALSFFAGCSAEKTVVTVLIVVDEGDDVKYEETLFEGSVEIKGKNPSVDTIINQLGSEGKITPEYSSDEEGHTTVVAINDLENKDEGTSPIRIHLWMAKINNGKEITGLWSEAMISNGDTIVIKYSIWDFDPSN